MNTQPEAEEIIAQYVKLTGREARVSIYEFSLFDFLRAGFTCEEFVMVLTFLLRENKRNKFQYSIKLGALINDHQRFMDLLGEAKAKQRSTPAKPTEAAKVLASWRGTKPVSASNGELRHISEVFQEMRKATNPC